MFEKIVAVLNQGGWSGVIAAGIAFIGVMISAVISLTVARRGNYLTSVTAERSKWIDKLRTNIAELAALCILLQHKSRSLRGTNFSEYRGTPEYEKIRERIETLGTTIRLQLNPEASVDKNIMRILDCIYYLAE